MRPIHRDRHHDDRRAARPAGPRHPARRIAPVLLALAAGHAAADNVPPTHSLLVSALAGVHVFSADDALEPAANLTAAVGFRFSDAITAELAAGRTQSDADPAPAPPADPQRRLDFVRVDALWHYVRSGRWQPYVLAGIGQQSIAAETGADADATVVSGGFGAFLKFDGPALLRLDARGTWNCDDDRPQALLSAGITLPFGGDRSDPP